MDGQMVKKGKRKGRNKASSGEQKKWLSEHFPYEVCMMRYGIMQMQRAGKQIDYNLSFECFAAKARVIHSFLTNKAQHNHDIQAADFSSAYSPPSIEKVKKTIGRWNAHAAHASNKRPDSVADKINLDDCVEMARWIEQALATFLAAVPDEMRKNWSDERAGDMLMKRAASFWPIFSASSGDPLIIEGTPTASNQIRFSDGNDQGA